ncbi:MAG: DUF3102 domain-containing protein [Planctomycetota bacterium]
MLPSGTGPTAVSDLFGVSTMSTENPNPNPAPIDDATTQLKHLDNLARQIKEHHGRFQASIRTSLECARDAGLALTQAKAIVKDDGDSWLQWLKKNCDLSSRQSQKYMKIAAGYDALMKNNVHTKARTINSALAMLAELQIRTAPSAQSPSQPTPSAPVVAVSLLPMTRDELESKKIEADEFVATEKIRLTGESPEGKFVKQKSQALVKQIRIRAEELLRSENRPKNVQAIHVAIAIVTQICRDLRKQFDADVIAPMAGDKQKNAKSDVASVNRSATNDVGPKSGETVLKPEPTNQLAADRNGNHSLAS